MALMPNTLNGLSAMEAVSAMQKCIRRSMELEAMEFAVELLHTSKAYCTMVCNRLEVICHEDLDTQGQLWLVPTVAACLAQARAHYKPERPDEAVMMVGTAIRIMSRARKSREGCHFAASTALRSIQDKFVPEIPEWAQDMHTYAGRRLGRGIEHFLSEGALLIPPAEPDPYEAAARKQWAVKYADRPDAVPVPKTGKLL